MSSPPVSQSGRVPVSRKTEIGKMGRAGVGFALTRCTFGLFVRAGRSQNVISGSIPWVREASLRRMRSDGTPAPAYRP